MEVWLLEIRYGERPAEFSNHSIHAKESQALATGQAIVEAARNGGDFAQFRVTGFMVRGWVERKEG